MSAAYLEPKKIRARALRGTGPRETGNGGPRRKRKVLSCSWDVWRLQRKLVDQCSNYKSKHHLNIAMERSDDRIAHGQVVASDGTRLTVCENGPPSKIDTCETRGGSYCGQLPINIPGCRKANGPGSASLTLPVHNAWHAWT